MTRKNGVYTLEFKTQAIAMVRDAKRSAAEVSRELGINLIRFILDSLRRAISRQRSLAITIMQLRTSS